MTGRSGSPLTGSLSPWVARRLDERVRTRIPLVGRPPRALNELLSDVLLALSREYEEAGAGEDPPPSLVLWSGLLRGLRPGGITVKELTREVRLSSRAVVGWLGAAATWGYLVPERSGRARQGDRIDVTDKWRAAADEWPGVEDAAAKFWRQRVGAPAAEELRAALEDLVSRFGLELPHYPIGYGPVDWSMTGGNHRPAKSGPPRVPSHGADWSPVTRGEGDTVSGLALPALVSQTLTWFQMDCESVGAYPQVVIDILRRIPSDGVPLHAQPPLAGTTGEGKSGFERHGVLEVKADKEGEKRVYLTALAERVADRYEDGASEIEGRWRDEYGARVVDRLRAALEATIPALGAPPDPPHHLWVVCQPGLGFVEPSLTKLP